MVFDDCFTLEALSNSLIFTMSIVYDSNVSLYFY
jgi:hypothetical protein